MIEVVTVYAPRPQHPKWRDYVTGMALQKATAERWGCRHVVVSDGNVPGGFNQIHVELPESLMHAQLVGQIAYLERWSSDHHILLVDADCLIHRDPTDAFTGFDLGLTWRDNPACMINNGAMYVAAGAKERVLSFFRHALTLCKEHWGGDQEAISQAAAPVPMKDGKRGVRNGAMVEFLSMRTHNCVPNQEGARHYKPTPFVVHFKGEARKDWMRTYSELYILG
jgi:hypothetical protein